MQRFISHRSSSVAAFALGIIVVVSVGGCASGTSPSEEPGESREPASVSSDIRAELSAAMSGHRVARYDEAWTVLTDGASIGDGRIRLFYTRRLVDARDRAREADQARDDYWNREHVWPRSFGIDGTDAETDLHNLVPVDRTVNSARGNRFYSEAGEPHRECEGCLIGPGSWAPPLEVRGDAARIAFYMDVRYEGTDGTDVLDLSLGDEPSTEARQFGERATLLAWHCDDPVSVEEVQRHEAVARVQGNRNAFVDSPELVASVYGRTCPEP